MIDDVTLYSLATFLLVPPVNLLFVTIAGLVLICFKRRAGRWISGVGVFLLLILAMPVASDSLLTLLEDNRPTTVPGDLPAAIVILSGDVQHIDGAEPQLGIGFLTLERLRAGAAVYRSTNLPVLTTGGIIGRKGPPVAELMAQSLAQDFSVPTRWVEPASRTTWENAELSGAILKAQNIHSIYLVTHAWHMRRALIAFTHFGIAVTPAPVSLDRPPTLGLGEFLPQASDWLHSYYAFHEWIGCAWYALRADLMTGPERENPRSAMIAFERAN